MAKQPLPVFIGAISCQLSALSKSTHMFGPGLACLSNRAPDCSIAVDLAGTADG